MNASNVLKTVSIAIPIQSVLFVMMEAENQSAKIALKESIMTLSLTNA